MVLARLVYEQVESRSGGEKCETCQWRFQNGAQITVENIGQLPMPTTVLMTFKDGTTQTVKLPVEVWKRNTEWTFQIDSNKEVTNVKLDPQSIVPDINPKNNFWPAN